MKHTQLLPRPDQKSKERFNKGFGKRLRPRRGRPVSTFCGGRQKREAFTSRQPLHLSLRLRQGLPSLRSRRGAQLLKHSVAGAQQRGLRVIHFSLLSDRIDMIVECTSPLVLSNAMKSFCSRLSLGLRSWAAVSSLRRLRRQGQGLFLGRYKAQILRSARQVKQSLSFVLLNASRSFKKRPYIDKFSSAASFKKWRKLLPSSTLPDGPFDPHDLSSVFENLISPPQCWLLRKGWVKAPL